MFHCMLWHTPLLKQCWLSSVTKAQLIRACMCCVFWNVCISFSCFFPSSCCPTQGSHWAHYSLPAQLTCGKGEINSQFHFAASVWQVLDRSGLGACKEQERELELVWPSPFPVFLSLSLPRTQWLTGSLNQPARSTQQCSARGHAQ